MARRSDYAALVKRAEQAVGSVKDPELKRAAFEKVLEDLLGNKAGVAAGPPSRSSKRIAATPRKPQGAGARVPRGGPHAYLEELVDDSFFKKPKTITQVKAELENRGHHIPMTSLSGPLQKLCQRRTLRRQRASTEGNKQAFNYSNW